MVDIAVTDDKVELAKRLLADPILYFTTISPFLEQNANKVSLSDQLGKMFDSISSENRLAKGVTQLKETLDQVNPYVVGKIEWYQRIWPSWLPGFYPMQEALREIAQKWQYVDGKVQTILDELRLGRDVVLNLVESNQQLKVRFEGAVEIIDGKIAFLESLQREVDNLETAEIEQNALVVKADLARAVQNLETAKTVKGQQIASLRLMIEEGHRVVDEINKMIATAPEMIIVSIRICATLAKQGIVLRSAEELKRNVAEMACSSAKTAKKGTESALEAYRSNVEAMEALTQARDKISENLQSTEEGMQALGQLIGKLQSA